MDRRRRRKSRSRSFTSLLFFFCGRVGWKNLMWSYELGKEDGEGEGDSFRGGMTTTMIIKWGAFLEGEEERKKRPEVCSHYSFPLFCPTISFALPFLPGLSLLHVRCCVCLSMLLLSCDGWASATEDRKEEEIKGVGCGRYEWECYFGRGRLVVVVVLWVSRAQLLFCWQHATAPIRIELNAELWVARKEGIYPFLLNPLIP